MWANIVFYFKMLSDSVRMFLLIPDIFKYFQIRQYIVGYCQTQPSPNSILFLGARAPLELAHVKKKEKKRKFQN